MNWLLKRGAEPSTWKGLAVLLSMAGYIQSEEVSKMLVVVGPQVIEQASSLVTILVAAWEVIRKEPANEIQPQ